MAGLLLAAIVGALLVRRSSGAIGRLHQSLFERLAEATVHWSDEEASTDSVALVAGATGPLVRIGLEDEEDWRQTSENRPGRLRNTGLVGWRLPLELPTAQAGAVRVQREGELLPYWARPRVPAPFGAFYADSGFFAAGLYVALPEEMDPRTLQLAALFPPESELLCDLLGARNEVIDLTTLVGWVNAGDQHRDALFVPNRAAIEIPASIPRAGELVFWATRRVYPWAKVPASTSLAVEVDAGAGWQEVERVIFSPFLYETEDRWNRVQVDLKEWGGREVALRFRVPDAEGVGRVAHYVAAPTLTAPPLRRPRPNLVVITVDGLRADLRPWEASSGTLTPTLADLAARGLTFTQVRSAAPWTRPSVASMFTGLAALRHGVDSEADRARLPTTIPTVAAALRSRGYATEALSANPHLDPAFGLPQGFSNVIARSDDGGTLTKRVLASLAERPYDPFFVFAFYMDTHAPWKDRPEYDDADLIDAPVRNSPRLGMARGRRERGEAEPTPQEVAKLRALYEENVRYVDAQIGELVEGLEQLQIKRDTVIVVTADHGEAFGEHGDFFHGWNVYDELSHVPLIAAGPGIPRGRRIDAPVSLTALPGLLLHWAGVDDDLLGTSREAQEILEGRQLDEPILMTTRFRNNQADALLRWPWKLILTPGGIQLYNLQDDPEERRDRAGEQRELASRLRRQLERRMAEEAAQRQAPSSSKGHEQPDETTLQHLRALGYVGDS